MFPESLRLKRLVALFDEPLIRNGFGALLIMAGKIFINYRRGDDPGFTLALYQRLEQEFSAGDLFMDVEGHIKPGEDFVAVLSRQVAECDVLLAVIGPRWANLMTARVADPDDFVVIEIKAALDLGKRVIPVLVGGAAMPRGDALPDPIRPLARRNAVGLRPERFKTDCQGLVTALKDQLASAEAERSAETAAERRVAEAARRASELEAAARSVETEQRAQAQANAGVAPDAIRKATELANWRHIEVRRDIGEVRDHLARFPDGVTERYALARLEELVWADLGLEPDIHALQSFLEEFPNGGNAVAARTKLATLQRQGAEANAAEKGRIKETAAWGAEHPAVGQAPIQEITQRRWLVQSARVTAGLVAIILGGWVIYSRVRLLPVFWDVSPSALTPAAEQALKSGESFKECATCPQMVVVPAGTFMMGSNDFDSEKPIHKVTLAKPLAVGKFEVTFDEWETCVAHGGCKQEPADWGWGRGKRPVIGVSWNDARQYVDWLSRLTGKTYRLLTEAEWEYAARAGSPTGFSFGDAIGELSRHAWYYYSGTNPVGGKTANAFGLHDMHGNVSEWVEDCWHDSYVGAPTDGSAWRTECTDSNLSVFRSGSWHDRPRNLRAAFRLGNPIGHRVNFLGFRVARALYP